MPSSELAAAAQRYLDWGLCLIPISPRNKKPMVQWQTYRHRQPTPEELASWLKHPNINVAIVCGAVSNNFTVLDFDDPQLYTEFCMFWQNLYGQLPEAMTPVVQTGGGGFHIYLFTKEPSPLFHPVGERRAALPDIQGDGGYVVAPPSIHPSGNPYRFLNGVGSIFQINSLEDLAIDIPAPTDRAAAAAPEAVIAEGGRNTLLTSLAGTMRRRGMTEQAICVALQAENEARCAPPLEPSEVYAIAHSVSRYSPTAPPTPPPTTETAPPPDVHNTDMGNAMRFAYEHGAAVRYCHLWGKWLIWDRQRWNTDTQEAIIERAKQTVRGMYRHASLLDDADARKDFIKWAIASEAEARINAMVSLAESEPRIPSAPTDFDPNPWLLNLSNGTLDLRTGELRSHEHTDLITKLAPAEYDPTAEAPLWAAFLNRIFGGDQALIGFVQRAVGYSLTGDTGEQIMFICYGLGANGKSTLIELLRYLVGNYSLHTPFTTFLAKDNEVVRNDLARLAGARFVSSVELRAGQRLDEVVVKQVTGSDTIAARFLYKEYFEYTPIFKLWLVANHKPVIKGVDDAIWRRIALIPFNVTIPVNERDKTLMFKLQAESSGILNWALAGCLQWQMMGLNPPDTVSAATAAYRAEMDSLGGFLADCCALVEGARTPAKDLYDRYVNWCDLNGEKAIDVRWFGRSLSDRGFVQGPKATGGLRTWLGIEIID